MVFPSKKNLDALAARQADYQMLKTLEALAERPLKYEYERPIEAIERALWCGLAVASEPREEFIQGRWRRVRTVTPAPRQS